MATRHSAVLALLGWYLMLPSIGHDGRANTAAPLSSWAQEASYDSASLCEAAVGDGIANVNGIDAHATDARVRYLHHHRWANARCIASDDPHLAK